MKNATATQTTVPATTAVVLYNAVDVRKLIFSGQSVPKDIVKAAPKGAIAAMRAERREELSKNTSGLLGSLADRGFSIVAMTDIKTSTKTGVQQVTLRMATPKPTSALTMAEFAKACGTTVEAIAETYGK